MNPKVRDSRPELLRLVLMFGIVFGHVLLHAVPGYATSPLLSFVKTLLHVAVPCFVLLSGWYGISPSVRGFFRIWTMCVFYGVVLFGISAAAGDVPISPRPVAAAFMPVYFGEWWFVDVYLALYVASPILETFLRNSGGKAVWLSIAGLFFVSFYVGNGPRTVQFANGKNLCHFAMLYLIGNRLRNLPPRIGARLQSAGFLPPCAPSWPLRLRSWPAAALRTGISNECSLRTSVPDFASFRCCSFCGF